MRRWKAVLPVLFCGVGVAAGPVFPAHWTVTDLPGKPVGPGAKFSLRLQAQIDAGWHIYALDEPEGGPIATEVGLAEGDPVTLLRVEEAQPQMVPDPFYKQATGLFFHDASFTLHLQAPKQRLPQDTVLHVQVRYQSCNDKVCLPPHTDVVPVPMSPLLR